MAMFMDWFCKKQGIIKLKPPDLEGLAFKLVKVFHPNVIHLQYQMEECHKLLTDSVDESIIRYNISKPLPLGGPPGQMKEAYYPDVGLKQMVPNQMWIEDECKYNIAAMYGISHWWFKRQRFYIDRHTSEGDRRAVRTHMRILSVVKIEVFSMYGYDYMKNIILRRVDLNEHIITERDFKYLYPSDFEDLYLLNLQVIDSPRAITFRDIYGVKMIMRFNEIHKFSDGTLHQINEALDYRVKEFKIKRMNPCLNTRFWTRKDVDKKHPSDTLVFTVKMEILLEPTSNKLLVVNELMDSFGKPFEESRRLQLLAKEMSIHNPCSHFKLIIKDMMIAERPTTQLRNSDACYYDPEKCGHAGPKVITSQEGNTPQQG
nr:hypothetical protein [Tanacetum cinerariifolium]